MSLSGSEKEINVLLKNTQVDEYYADIHPDNIVRSVTSLSQNPYPGLRPFRTSEYPVLFGRQEICYKLIHLMSEHNFLTVIGASGAGKSSLIRAGLLPSLQSLPGKYGAWKVAICRPGNNPFANLARAISEAGIFEKLTIAEIYAGIKESSYGFERLYDDAINAGKDAMPFNSIIIIDQFEELFRYRKDNGLAGLNETALFVKMLIDVSENKNLNTYVLLTMRSEYLSDCVQIPGLAEKINIGQFLVPGLTIGQMKEVIVHPLAFTGAEAEEGLDNKLIGEMSEVGDPLSVLQHALRATYNKAVKEAETSHADQIVLKYEHYVKIGKIQNALSLHGDKLFEQLTAQQQKYCKLMFQALTLKTSEGRIIRRPTVFLVIQRICEDKNQVSAEIVKTELKKVIDCFRADNVNFLMPPPHIEINDDTEIDISHESLMRNWGMLKEWMDEEVKYGKLYTTLNERRELSEQPYKNEWIRGGLLEDMMEWQANYPHNATWAGRYHSIDRNVKNFDELNEEIYQKNLLFLKQSKLKEEELKQKELDIVTAAEKARLAQVENELVIKSAREQALLAEQAQLNAVEKAGLAEKQTKLVKQERDFTIRKLKQQRRNFFITGAVFLLIIGSAYLMMRKLAKLNNAAFSLAAIANIDNAGDDKKVALKILINSLDNFNVDGIPTSLLMDGPQASKRKIINIFNANNLGAKTIQYLDPAAPKQFKYLTLSSCTVFNNDKNILVVYQKPLLPNKNNSPGKAINFQKPTDAKQYISILYNSNGDTIKRWFEKVIQLQNSNLLGIIKPSRIEFYNAGGNKKHPPDDIVVENRDPQFETAGISSMSYSSKGILIMGDSLQTRVYDIKNNTYISLGLDYKVKNTTFSRIFLKDGNILVTKSIYATNSSFGRSTENVVQVMQVVYKNVNYQTGSKSVNYNNLVVSPDKSHILVLSNNQWILYNEGDIKPLKLTGAAYSLSVLFDTRNNFILYNNSSVTGYDSKGGIIANLPFGPGFNSVVDFKNNTVLVQNISQKVANDYSDLNLSYTLKLIDLKNIKNEIDVPVRSSINNSTILLSNGADAVIINKELFDNEQKVSYKVDSVFRVKPWKLLSDYKIYNSDPASEYLILDSSITRSDNLSVYNLNSRISGSTFANSLFSSKINPGPQVQRLKVYNIMQPVVSSSGNVDGIIKWADTLTMSPAETKTINKFMHHTDTWFFGTD